MSLSKSEAHKQLRRPAGCEGHLTRRQVAALLGFASEFKVRELERRGQLRSVRGPMRAAFYPRPDVLALRARLAHLDPERCQSQDWTDADLITLLEHPGPSGEPRTALDLVIEARVSIERAEQVHAFWLRQRSPATVEASLGPPSVRRPSNNDERRSPGRLSRDTLIHDLRDPDPRVRQQAFERLRESREDE
jgi:hypothetical protein